VLGVIHDSEQIREIIGTPDYVGKCQALSRTASKLGRSSELTSILVIVRSVMRYQGHRGQIREIIGTPDYVGKC
jgi:hypothetical protein